MASSLARFFAAVALLVVVCHRCEARGAEHPLISSYHTSSTKNDKASEQIPLPIDSSDPLATLAALYDPDFAFPSIVSAFLPLPFITSGNCTGGRTYTIQRIGDLFDNLGELECIFAAGLSPTTVGLGYNYGTLLTAANTAVPAVVAPVAYQGDYVVRTRCGDRVLYIGTLHVGGLSIGTAEWSIGPLPGDVAPGEYYNPKDNLVMDFRIDIRDICPVEDPAFPFNIRGFVPFHNSIPPVNSFVDIGRVVGRGAKDGGTILLNKAMATDPTRGFATVLYYAIKNFDPAVNPNFAVGTPITVPESFTYSREGIRAPIERLGTSIDVTQAHIASRLRNIARTVLAGQFAEIDITTLLNSLPASVPLSLGGLSGLAAGLGGLTGLGGLGIPPAEADEQQSSASESVPAAEKKEEVV